MTALPVGFARQGIARGGHEIGRRSRTGRTCSRRAALLPRSLAAVEIDGSWRLGYVLLALCGWAALGLLAAPPVLRRMARHESGSKVAARRERAMLRAT